MTPCPDSMTIIDCHTHQPRPQAVVQASPSSIQEPGLVYSVGIHPWDTAGDFDMKTLRAALLRPGTVAVGEAGLDALRGAPMERQIEIFEAQIELSESLGLPLIIHCVRASHHLLELRRHLKPSQPWIYHGFRGGAAAARQLLDAGLYLSLGPKFNDEAARAIPSDRLMIETDDTVIDIADVARSVSAARGNDITDTATELATAIFSGGRKRGL